MQLISSNLDVDTYVNLNVQECLDIFVKIIT